MASAKGWLASRLGRFLLKNSTVVAVTAQGAFRRVDLEGADLKGVTWQAGDKVQVLLPGQDMRTYTPLDWDAVNGRTSLLVLVRGGDTPGSAWGRNVAPGDAVSFFRPERSLKLASTPGPLVLFGDETSFAAAHALTKTRSAPVSAVFEVAFDGLDDVLGPLALDSVSVARDPSDSHLDRATDALVERLARHPGATLALTGRAQSIQGIRAKLRERGVQAPQKVKAYWSEGKTGLD